MNLYLITVCREQMNCLSVFSLTFINSGVLFCSMQGKKLIYTYKNILIYTHIFIPAQNICFFKISKGGVKKVVFSFTPHFISYSKDIPYPSS